MNIDPVVRQSRMIGELMAELRDAQAENHTLRGQVAALNAALAARNAALAARGQEAEDLAERRRMWAAQARAGLARVI